MADFNDVAVVENNEVVDEPIQGEVVNMEDTYEGGERVTVKDAALAAGLATLIVLGTIDATKKIIKVGRWAGGKAVEGFGKLKSKFGKKKEAEVTEDVAEVTTEEVKAE